MKIYQNTFAFASDEGVIVAFIRISIPSSFPFDEENFQNAFRKTVWDTPLSNVDLDVCQHSSVSANAVLLESIVEFGDEDKAGCVIPFPEELRFINFV